MSAQGEEYNYLQFALEKAVVKIRVSREAQVPPSEALAQQFENFAAAFMTILGLIGAHNCPILMRDAKILALSTLGVTAAAFSEPYSLEELNEAIEKMQKRGQLKEVVMKKDEKFPCV